jgi:hypothetical protein
MLQLARTKDVSTPEGKDHSFLIAVTVVALVIVVLVAGSFIKLSSFHASQIDLRAVLKYSAVPDPSGVGGTLGINGTIYNYGGLVLQGNVSLRVYDGYSWYTYLVGTGQVPAGGSVPFVWNVTYDQMNQEHVCVTWTVIR